jgi:rod shape-determining protein MreC
VAAATRRTNQQLTLLMLVLASITVLTLDYHGEANRGITHLRNGVRDALAPVQRGIAAALHPVGDVFAGAFHYGALESENQRLQDQLGAVQSQQAEGDFAERQAAALLTLSHLSFVQEIPTTPAEVLSAPTSNFEYTVEINRGTSSGVGPRMPVVGAKGLAGTVVESGRDTATVQLVTDKSSSIGVTFGTGAKLGSAIANGQGLGEPMVIDELAGAAPHVGDVVFTSGTDGGAYPAGIPVATVTSVHVSSGGLAVSVVALPLVSVGTLQYVSVCEWLPQA